MMDSLTRVAMAQREIGLAVGEPPTTKGYPPSVFSLLPKLLERCGPQARGSISGLYTVLVDGDDFNEPIADAARSILDGHVVLSRTLAARHHFPAIDITNSTSRVMHDIVDRDHQDAAAFIKMLMGTYQENFDYVQIGSYQAGTNPTLDTAIRLMPSIEKFLKQDRNELCPYEKALEQLAVIVHGPNRANPGEYVDGQNLSA
jgi:flagellum-specific ATP synthase